ncbi:uncharacterized protein LOC117169713 [Belonocnema kinseyi]|uniref:uncharacterized protein LOC117169713 n=1 Tax=Belonocnema kinseyi TaxID=2817044 RepID=UPI00143D6AC5|nr:uncharacterized protein LOC117169713 [Belonocnema kinseyi]
MIQTQKAVKHLGIHMNTKLTFWEHIRKAADKAVKTTTGLSRLMANVGGPKPSKRCLLMSVTTSILLYGAKIWADALRIDKYRRRMAGVQRLGAQRIACSYRTVSEPAVLAYLNKIGKVRSSDCRYCGWYRDDASHTFFTCDRWVEERTILETDIGSISPDNIIHKMLSSQENWQKVAVYVETVSREKKREEHLA